MIIIRIVVLIFFLIFSQKNYSQEKEYLVFIKNNKLETISTIFFSENYCDNAYTINLNDNSYNWLFVHFPESETNLMVSCLKDTLKSFHGFPQILEIKEELGSEKYKLCFQEYQKIFEKIEKNKRKISGTKKNHIFAESGYRIIIVSLIIEICPCIGLNKFYPPLEVGIIKKIKKTRKINKKEIIFFENILPILIEKKIFKEIIDRD